MSSIVLGARRSEVGRRSARSGRGRLHDGPEPWSRRSFTALAAVLAIALAGLTAAWAGAGGEAKLSRQAGWLALALGSLLLAWSGMVAWLLVGLRTVAEARRPALAQLRRIKQAELAALPRPVVAAPTAGFGWAPGMRHYHLAGCAILDGKAFEFLGAADHVAAGRVPCGLCRPDDRSVAGPDA